MKTDRLPGKANIRSTCVQTVEVTIPYSLILVRYSPAHFFTLLIYLLLGLSSIAQSIKIGTTAAD